jgi:chromatin segregation and condensation protein Rec8/ScpA/Scc1 (kleisin family)
MLPLGNIHEKQTERDYCKILKRKQRARALLYLKQKSSLEKKQEKTKRSGELPANNRRLQGRLRRRGSIAADRWATMQQ